MKIKEVIEKMKKYHKGSPEIKAETSRDQILYGFADQECTGIVTTCWATMDVIVKAHEAHANLIICHEGLFWNHGDHTDWLQAKQNYTYLQKKKLLDETGIVVWRDHDYIHSGIPIEDGTYCDGIFYGFAKQMHWETNIVAKTDALLYELPALSVSEIGNQMLKNFHLEGMKIIGDLDTLVKKAYICAHVMGHGDNDLITKVDQEDIDLLITLELIDYTLSAYIRDACMAKQPKAIIALGHFNAEEPGMAYMTSYISKALGVDIPSCYIQSGDMYHYLKA